MPFACLSFHFTCQDGEQAKSETGVKLFLLLHLLLPLPLPLLADWRYFALVTYGYIVAGAGAGAAAGRSWSRRRRRSRSNSKVRKLPERQRRPPWKLWCNLYLILPHVYIKATRAPTRSQNYTQPHTAAHSGNLCNMALAEGCALPSGHVRCFVLLRVHANYIYTHKQTHTLIFAHTYVYSIYL